MATKAKKEKLIIKKKEQTKTALVKVKKITQKPVKPKLVQKIPKKQKVESKEKQPLLKEKPIQKVPLIKKQEHDVVPLVEKTTIKEKAQVILHPAPVKDEIIKPQVLEKKATPIIKEAIKETKKQEIKKEIPLEPKKEIHKVEQAPIVEEKKLKELELNLPITVKDLAIKLQEKPSVLIKTLMDMRFMVGINQFLDEQTVTMVCEKYGFKIKQALGEEELALMVHDEKDAQDKLKNRPPIVTFMGHVDHGKTSLLDAIRKTKVVDSEHGGITQHIGAYRVHLPQGDITFLDTPGHEAFTAMRARGASVTDMVVLVVAADDGIMPQTKEAIDHARAADVSIIVAINKIDKPQADIDKVKKQLGELNLLSENWGGKTITVPVSAKTGEGIDNLLEMILLEAQMLELKANPNRAAKGIVIEAKMSKGKGPVATLLVQNGTLHLNQPIIIGSCFGKVRAMFNHLGAAVTEAGPAYPVEVLGISGVPDAGEQFYVIEDEKKAKEIIEKRLEIEKLSQVKTVKRISLEDLHSQIKEGKIKELKIIIKADVQGSLEAIKDTLSKISITEIKLDTIHEGIGNINSSDIILAVASNALVLGFNVVSDDRAKEIAFKEGVDVKIYNIIYELANDIKLAIEGMLEPKLKKVFLGRAQVKKVFKLSRSGTVAGCIVAKGKIARSARIALVRNGEEVFEGSISNLKRFKDDVKEVAEGFECGITLSGYDNLQEGDYIDAFIIEKIARKI